MGAVFPPPATRVAELRHLPQRRHFPGVPSSLPRPAIHSGPKASRGAYCTLDAKIGRGESPRIPGLAVQPAASEGPTSRPSRLDTREVCPGVPPVPCQNFVRVDSRAVSLSFCRTDACLNSDLQTRIIPRLDGFYRLNMAGLSASRLTALRRSPRTWLAGISYEHWRGGSRE